MKSWNVSLLRLFLSRSLRAKWNGTIQNMPKTWMWTAINEGRTDREKCKLQRGTLSWNVFQTTNPSWSRCQRFHYWFQQALVRLALPSPYHPLTFDDSSLFLSLFLFFARKGGLTRGSAACWLADSMGSKFSLDLKIFLRLRKLEQGIQVGAST